MKFVIATEADFDPREIVCQYCRKLLSICDDTAQTHTPEIEDLIRDGAVAVPNFGWFCGQDCGVNYSRKYDVVFQRDTNGKIAYY
jgi:hypothetical protein